MVVQPFFRNTIVPLNHVSCGHFWEARVKGPYLKPCLFFSMWAFFNPPSLRAPKKWLFLLPLPPFLEYEGNPGAFGKKRGKSALTVLLRPGPAMCCTGMEWKSSYKCYSCSTTRAEMLKEKDGLWVAMIHVCLKKLKFKNWGMSPSISGPVVSRGERRTAQVTC